MEAVQPAPAGPGLLWLRTRLFHLTWRQVGAATLTGIHVQVILEGSQGRGTLGTAWDSVGTKPEGARVTLSQTG